MARTNEQPDDSSPVVERVRGFLRTLVGPLSLAGSLVGLSSLAVWAAALFGTTYVENLKATFVVLTGLSLLALAVYLQYQLFKSRHSSMRARSLAKAQSELAEAFGHLSRAAELTARPHERDDTRRHGDWATQRFANAFSTIVGAPCRVTVKQLFSPESGERLAVKDLFRSHPARVVPEGHVDWVDENTDFEEILANGTEFWICPDVVQEFDKRYKNSHVTREQAAQGDVPYRSVMVVRIASIASNAGLEVLGFLCIDSTTSGIFRKNFDVSTAKTFSHALYSILTWYRRSETTPPQGAKPDVADSP